MPEAGLDKIVPPDARRLLLLGDTALVCVVDLGGVAKRSLPTPNLGCGCVVLLNEKLGVDFPFAWTGASCLLSVEPESVAVTSCQQWPLTLERCTQSKSIPAQTSTYLLRDEHTSGMWQ